MMFAALRNYHTDKGYYEAHPYMYIYTPSQDYRLDLYAGFVCDHDDEDLCNLSDPVAAGGHGGQVRLQVYHRHAYRPDGDAVHLLL